VLTRARDKHSFVTSTMHISSPYPMFDHLLESSHRDDSNKLSNIGFDEEITQVLKLICTTYAELWFTN